MVFDARETTQARTALAGNVLRRSDSPLYLPFPLMRVESGVPTPIIVGANA